MADTQGSHGRHGARFWVDVVLAIVVGVLSVVQARINGALAVRVGSGTEAALWSFLTGLVIVLALIALTPSGRAGAARLTREVRSRAIAPWLLLGGLGGATFVASQGLVVPSTGVALFTVAVVAGLTGNSLVADRLGVGPGGRRQVTLARVLAAAITVAGVALAVSGSAMDGHGHVGLLVFAVFAGALVAIQQGLNGRVAVAAGSPLTAAGVNFVVGCTALLLLTEVFQLAHVGTFVAPPAPWDEPVLWLGGPIGVVFVGVAAFAVRELGVLLFSLLTIVGQLVGGVLTDLVAPLPGADGVTWQTFAAVGMCIGATALAFLGSRARRSAAPAGTMPV